MQLALSSRASPLWEARTQSLFGLFLLLSLNGITGLVWDSVSSAGPARAIFDLFGVSAVVWLAIPAGLLMLWNEGPTERLKAADPAVFFLALLAAITPLPNASGIGLTFFSFYVILTSAPGSTSSRAAIIFLSITGALIWGRLALSMFSELLSVDAYLVSLVFATDQNGNMLSLVDGNRVAIAPGCSSLQGMSLALVFWATVNQWYKVQFTWRAVGWCLAALAATVALNVVRIGAMVHFPQHLSEIHHGVGWHVFMWATLSLVVGICIYGARRDVFSR